MNHEAEFIRQFVTPAKRRRYLSLIETGKGRKKFLGTLDHFDELDTRYARLLPPSIQTIVQIEAVLRQKGAPERCHVISSNVDIDDREMRLSEALQQTIGRGSGTVVSYIPGKLAYFEAKSRTSATSLSAMDQTGALANVKRHDYWPFGEELFAPAGGHSSGNGYTGGDGVRQQFKSKERDNETGLHYPLPVPYAGPNH